MKAIAYAKVNLSLEVGTKRSDGYHPYESMAMSVGLADTMSLSVSHDDERAVSVRTSTGLADTLATQAARTVLDAADVDAQVAIHIEKQIPPGAGLAGGSADAAATLIATRELIDADDLDLGPLATGIGTDVPFCLNGGFARLHGRGELVEQREPLPPFGVLIAVPPVSVSTVMVFAAFDQVSVVPEPEPAPGWLIEIVPGCSFRNDLERAAFEVEPELPAWKAIIEDATGHTAFMSGTGSAYVCYAEDTDSLDELAPMLHREGIAAWVTEPVAYGVRTIG